jgi:hypothetical protein
LPGGAAKASEVMPVQAEAEKLVPGLGPVFSRSGARFGGRFDGGFAGEA